MHRASTRSSLQEGTAITSTAAEPIAEFVVGLRAQELPQATVTATTEHLLDPLGRGLGGQSMRAADAPRFEARLCSVAPISNNLVPTFIGQHVPGMPRSH
jgi:hypothetical protein